MATTNGRHEERNRLLLALSGAEYEQLLPSLEIHAIPTGRVLHRTHQPITSVYFPQRSVVSMLIAGDDGEAVEVRSVGNEGVVGLEAVLAEHTASAKAVTRVPDHAMKMSAGAFRVAWHGSASFRDILLRYMQTVISTLARATLCHRVHRVEARCARCLLTTQDRVGADRFLLTQFSLAQMVGARRPSIAAAAVGLRRAGLIQYSRGRMTIVDRGGLEDASCSCYGVMRHDFERTFNPGGRTHS